VSYGKVHLGTGAEKSQYLFQTSGHLVIVNPKNPDTTMDELPPMPSTARYYFRFLDTIGFGSCNGCSRIGPRDHLCLHCCVSEGMELGSCHVCHHGGPAWEMCQWCAHGRCLVGGYGVCNDEDCEYYGPLNQSCSECGHGVFVPLTVDSLFCNSAEVVLKVVLPTTGVYHVVFINNEATFVLDNVVSSRTRSSD